MRLKIDHLTHYRYGVPAVHTVQALCLTPQICAHQSTEHWQLQAPGPLFESVDAYGNTVHMCSVTGPLDRGSIRAQGVVHTHGAPELVDNARAISPLVYLRSTGLAEPHPRITHWAADFLDHGVAASALLELAHAVQDKVSYRPGHTDVETTALEAFDWGKGVCQDQAHVLIAACRGHGLPARYVSGYFYAANAPELASHAWVDICLDAEARRWLSVDVTHACLMDERHVRLAVGPEYAACPPVKGVRHGGDEESLVVRVEIQRL